MGKSVQIVCLTQCLRWSPCAVGNLETESGGGLRPVFLVAQYGDFLRALFEEVLGCHAGCFHGSSGRGVDRINPPLRSRFGAFIDLVTGW